MNALVPFAGGSMPAVLQQFAGMPDMNAAAQAGLLPSFSVVGFKGRNWRLKHRGEEILIKDDRGVPAATLDVVIVGIAPQISKQFYDKKYTEGDDSAPDCFSMDGVAPDVASPKKQCATCAVCPQNVWGSKITEAGKKAKACQDSRRLAVVPLGDILNANFGGPMLLRLPPTSLNNLASFSRELMRFGAQPFMVATSLGFDYDVAYPLITFKPTGWIADAEQADQIRQVIDDPDGLIKRMLNEEVTEATHDPGSPENSALASGGPAATLAAPQPSAPVQQVAPANSPAPAAPAPVVAKAEKKSPFSQGAKASAPASAPAPAPVQAAAPEPAPPAPEIVQQAPTDMEAEIDALLSGG